MSRTARHLAIVAALALAFAGCKKASAGYCIDDTTCDMDEHCDVPNMICVSDLTPDGAPTPCDSTHPCPEQGPNPVCDLDNGVCVPCGPGEPGACGGTEPVCVDHTCTACVVDLDCPSAVCMEDGSCADAGEVLYAAPGGVTTGDCADSAKCDLAYAVSQLTGTKDVVHLDPGTYTTNVSLNLVVSATIIGRDAIVDYTGADNPVFRISGASTVGAFAYLTITGGTGTTDTTGNGIYCPAGGEVIARQVTITGNAAHGINAGGCTVTVAGSLITLNRSGINASSDSSISVEETTIVTNSVAGIAIIGGELQVHRSIVADNAQGGIQSLSDNDMVLENNVIADNGTSGTTGGISITGNMGTRVIRFNTIANNRTGTNVADGVSCGPGAVIDGSSNIIDDDGATLSLDACPMRSSLWVDGFQIGNGNITGDPGFLSTNLTTPISATYYRIGPASAALDVAEDILSVTTDLDGEPRPAEVGTGRDIGADERQP